MISNRHMDSRTTVRRRSWMVDVLVLSFVALLVGCGGGGGGSGTDTGTGTGGGTGSGGTGAGGSSAAGSGTIAGTVLDGTAGTPVNGATVSGGGKNAQSQADGSFTLSGVPAGTVQVVGSATGLGSKSAVVFLNNGETLALNLVLGQAGGSTGGGGGAATAGPRIVSSNPSNNTSGIDANTAILFTLDQSIRTDTLIAADGTGRTPSVVFTRLTTPSVSDTSLATVFKFSNLANTFEYRPGNLAPLLPGTRYALTITNRLIGTNGQPSAGSTFNFSVAGSGGSDDTGSGAPQTPRLAFTSPANFAADVDPNSRVVFAFDRAMRTSSLTVGATGSIVFSKITPPSANDSGGQLVIPTDLSIANVFEYIPGTLRGAAGLSSATTYALFVTNKALSSSGVPSAGEQFQFLIKRQDTGSPPVITASNPSNATTGVDPNTRIFVTLSGNTDVSTVFGPPLGVKLTQLTSPVGDLTIGVTLTAASPPTFELINLPLPLSGNTLYQVSINNNVKNTDGIRSLGSAVSFVTRASGAGGGPITPPRLAFISPLNGARDVDPRTRIIFSFDSPMTTGTVTSTNPLNVVLTKLSPPSENDNGPTIVANPPDLSGIPNVFEYRPGTFSSGLTPGTTFALFVTNRVLSSGGVPSQGESFSFTVKQLSEGLPPVGPRVESANPTFGEVNVDPSTQILITFDKPIFADSDPVSPRAFNPGSTVNPSTLVFARLTNPADTDRTVNVTSASPTVLTLFSGTEARAIAAPNPVPSSGVTVTVPGGPFGNQLPIVFRPDPENFPRTFRYVPGSQALQSGNVDYRLSITNGVRDSQGASAFTTSVDFRTRQNTSGPAGGPRLRSANPNKDVFTGAGTRIFLEFDQDIDLRSVLGTTQGRLAFSMVGHAIPSQVGCFDPAQPPTLCDLRPPALDGDLFSCVCSTANLTDRVEPVFDTAGVTSTRIIEVVPNRLGGNNPFNPAAGGFDTVVLLVTNQVFSLPDPTTGVTRTAPGDATWFYIR
jgi:hypothetical protein